MDRERTSHTRLRARAAERARAATAAARRLTHRPSAILSAADVGLLTCELRRIMAASFPGLPASALARSDDTIRWHPLGARCREARGPRSIRDVSVALAIPQYRLNAIERGRLSEIREDLARRSFGSSAWTRGWHAGVGRTGSSRLELDLPTSRGGRHGAATQHRSVTRRRRRPDDGDNRRSQRSFVSG